MMSDFVEGVVDLQLLEERIRKDGKVFPGNILKVDSFLNHQIDVRLLEQIGEEFYRLFSADRIDKILSVEKRASQVGGCGIRYACMICGKRRNLYMEKDKWFIESHQP